MNVTINIEKIIDTVVIWLTTYSMRIVAAILVFLIGKWFAKKISRLLSVVLQKNNVEETLIHFLENIIYYCLFVLVIVAVAGQLGINTTSFLTVLGAAGLAVGLALKDSLSNIAAGVMIIFLRSFKVNDVVKVAGVTGHVVKINIFQTTINTLDNKKVIIPNSSITNDVITNIFVNPTRRVDMVFGIGYNDDISKAKGILNSLAESDPRILKDPAPTIAVSEHADSSINFVVRPWVKSENYWDVFFDYTEKVKLAFDKEGVTIPFPQRDIHVHQITEKE